MKTTNPTFNLLSEARILKLASRRLCPAPEVQPDRSDLARDIVAAGQAVLVLGNYSMSQAIELIPDGAVPGETRWDISSYLRGIRVPNR